MALDKIQTEIAKVLVTFTDDTLYSEAKIAKKIRDNTKITNKKKAGLRLTDIEKAAESLGESNQLAFAFRMNSANDLLVKKSGEMDFLTGDQRHRRLSSEKSMTIMTSQDMEFPAKSDFKKKNKENRRNIRDYMEE